MKRRRPFFLLEIVLATLLIALFSYFSIDSLYHSTRKQEEMLRQLEYAREMDGRRMELLERYWKRVHTLPRTRKEALIEVLPVKTQRGTREVVLNPTQQFRLWSPRQIEPRLYLLRMEEYRPVHLSPQIRSRSGQKGPSSKWVAYTYLVPRLPGSSEENGEDGE